ncbi:MAG: serine/threonine protein kinase, partial [Deltaproteobacteria bacterium]
MARSYRLLEKLGEGAFGEVHLAELREDDEDFVQTLAVKWLHSEYSGDPAIAGRLRDEARLLALLNHDHIVRVHGLTRLDGRLAVLMEPVDGIDLSEVAGECVPQEAALTIIAAVADALGAAWNAHPRGTSGPLRVVHRDIKPSNIMVTRTGAVKVMDFGVARAHFDNREAQTRSQQFGTARYMAPERWLHGESDAPSDIFSLGITMIELITGTEVERFRLARKAFAEDLERVLDRLADKPEIRALAAEMCALEADARPDASEVAGRARELAPGGVEALRAWAEARCVPRAGTKNPSPTVLAEEVSAETFAVTTDLSPTATATADVGLFDRSSGDLSADLARRPWFWPLVLGTILIALLFGVFLGFQQAPVTVVEAPVETASAAPLPAPVEPVPVAAPEPAP